MGLGVARVEFEGMADLRAALRALPVDLAHEGAVIVRARADETARRIRDAYRAQVKGGDGVLESRVHVSGESQPYAAFAVVKSAAPHASLYEFGTGSLNVHHPGSARQTDAGHGRGSTPPHPTVIPIAMRNRRAMYAALIDLVRRAGFEVRGDF